MPKKMHKKNKIVERAILFFKDIHTCNMYINKGEYNMKSYIKQNKILIYHYYFSQCNLFFRLCVYGYTFTATIRHSPWEKIYNNLSERFCFLSFILLYWGFFYIFNLYLAKRLYVKLCVRFVLMYSKEQFITV